MADILSIVALTLPTLEMLVLRENRSFIRGVSGSKKSETESRSDAPLKGQCSNHNPGEMIEDLLGAVRRARGEDVVFRTDVIPGMQSMPVCLRREYRKEGAPNIELPEQ